MTDVLEKLAELDALVHRGNTTAEQLSDGILRAVLIKAIPEPLKNHLQVNSSTFVTYDMMRRATRDSKVGG